MNEQSQRELMIKAAVKFGGEWPDGYIALIVSTEVNGCWGAGTYRDFISGEDRFTCIMGDRKTWQWVCTREEFALFMDDLADKAPEGAEYVTPSDGFGIVDTCYYRNIQDDYYEYCYEGESFWDENEGKPAQGPIITFPTAAEIERQALYDSLCELDADLDHYQINCLIEFIQGRDDE